MTHTFDLGAFFVRMEVCYSMDFTRSVCCGLTAPRMRAPGVDVGQRGKAGLTLGTIQYIDQFISWVVSYHTS